MGRKRRAFTREFIAEAVQTYRASRRPLHEVAHELGIAPSVLRSWHQHPDHYIRENPAPEIKTRDRIIIYTVLLLVGGLVIFVFERERFASAAEGLAALGFAMFQVYVLWTLVLALFDRTQLRPWLIATTLVLIAINVTAWAMGQSRLVKGELLMTGLVAGFVLLKAGAIALSIEVNAWLSGIK